MAHIRLFRLVPIQMLSQSRQLREGPATLWTVMHLRSTCMQPLVSIQRFFSAELGRARLACVRHLACMHTLVFDELGLSRKHFSADVTGVGFVPHVDRQVHI